MADIVTFEDEVRFELFGADGVRTIVMRPDRTEIDLRVGVVVAFEIVQIDRVVSERKP